MIEISRILVPVDFSEFARAAVDHAVSLARRYEATITALHVYAAERSAAGLAADGAPVILEPVVLSDHDQVRLVGDLERFVGAESAPGVRAEVMVTQGPVVAEILRIAQELPADLVIMGTHGRSGFERLLLGSVTEKVLRKATCPVFTVPRRAAGVVPAGPILFKRIVCPVDFSASSLKAMEYACLLAEEADAQLTLVHALELLPEYGSREYELFVERSRSTLEADARQKLKASVPETVRAYCTVDEVVTAGKPYREILRIAAERQAELIVIGVQGRGAVDVALFGSTTQHVLRQATCPVLTVKGDG